MIYASMCKVGPQKKKPMNKWLLRHRALNMDENHKLHQVLQHDENKWVSLLLRTSSKVHCSGLGFTMSACSIPAPKQCWCKLQTMQNPDATLVGEMYISVTTHTDKGFFATLNSCFPHRFQTSSCTFSFLLYSRHTQIANASNSILLSQCQMKELHTNIHQNLYTIFFFFFPDSTKAVYIGRLV